MGIVNDAERAIYKAQILRKLKGEARLNISNEQTINQLVKAVRSTGPLYSGPELGQELNKIRLHQRPQGFICPGQDILLESGEWLTSEITVKSAINVPGKTFEDVQFYFEIKPKLTPLNATQGTANELAAQQYSDQFLETMSENILDSEDDISPWVM